MRVVFDSAARFVGKLTEIYFERVARCAQHIDIRAGAEDARLEAGNDDHLDLGMLETQPLNNVGKFDVYTEIVRVQLQLIALCERHIFLNVHGQRSHRASDTQLPVFVLVR